MKVEHLPAQIKGGCSVDIPPCYYPDWHCQKDKRGEPTLTTRRRWADNARHGYRQNQCQTPATYRVDGEYYCPSHAGQLALKHLEEGTDPVGHEGN